MLLQNHPPILIIKDGSFSFYYFLELGKIHRIPFSVTGDLLSVSAVNMYHLEEIIHNIKNKILTQHPGAIPVFFDFTTHYVDDSIPSETANFLFNRDLRQIEYLATSTDRPVLFIERGKVVSSSNQVSYRSFLHHTSSISMNLSNDNSKIIKENLTLEEKQKLYGSTSSSLFNQCRQFIQGVESISQITQERGSDIFRRIFQNNITKYTGRQRNGQSIPNGNSLINGHDTSSQIQLQFKRRSNPAS